MRMSNSVLLRVSYLLLGSMVFGSSGASTSGWKLNYDFEAQPVGATCGNWDFASGSTVTADKAATGKHSCRISVSAGIDPVQVGWGGGMVFPQNLNRGDEIWFRVKTYMPTGFDYGAYGAGNRLKFLRIHTANADGSNIGYDDLYIQRAGSSNPFDWIYEGEGVWSPVGVLSDQFQYEKWETYEMYVKLDIAPVSAGGQAHVRVWKNGVLLKDITDRITLQNSGAYANLAYLFSYWNGGAPKAQFMYVDDVVLQTVTPAARDADGFPYVGVDTAVVRPLAPSAIQVR